ncbi:MAG: tetratricopeptide repeat protein [Campylobacterota bacterium]|nr:tetratricopeptide repeat protein [Campylobacterota bacterium]
MAEEQEEIIIIDEADAAGVEHQTANEADDGTSSSRIKTILIAAIALLLLLLVLIIIIAMLPSDKEAEKQMDIGQLEEKLKQPTTEPVEASQLEKMIAKANFLYSHGSKDTALALYERIAVYSEAISQYNLGVAQLKEGQYESAFETFKRAIGNGENRCVSAINAAVCALHLNEQESFEYYIDLAQAYLPYESKSPLYGYYYTLINYYKGHYLELLLSLKHPTSDEYVTEKKQIGARVNALMGDSYAALSTLEAPYEERDAFSLGLLYANIGDLTLAKQYLSDAILHNPKPIREQLALAYVYLKSGLHADAGKLIRTLTDMYGEEVYTLYPVKVFLKDALFDPDAAQEQYRNKLIKKRNINYHKIFYFAPYKIFNAEQTISYIRKGTANIYIDDISSAKEYLSKSSKTSSINQGIAQAIKKALSFRLRDANSQLKSLLKLHPRHSILQYNLALTYAQIGDMVNAHKHFLRSYHLDANNYLSGIFSLMTAQLTHQENEKMRSILKDNLAEEEESEEFELYRTILNYSEDNLVGSLKWLENSYQERPLYLVLNLLIGQKLTKPDVARKAAEKLTYQLPNDILPHLLYIDTHFGEMPQKMYAKSVLNYIKEQRFGFEDLYFGPFITRFLYTQIALITGKLYPLRVQLKEKLLSTTESPEDIMAALALASIYDQAFEEAYTLYNQIIDNHKVQDTLTLYLGAIASTGASHTANAIGLLELAKLKDSKYTESRYALGLLYLEAKNNHGAGIQFEHIGNSGFISEYFNFMVDTNKLLFEKQNKTEK